MTYSKSKHHDNITTYLMLELYNKNHYNIYNNHIYTYVHLPNRKIKGYDACINQQGNPNDHTSNLKAIQGFTSFPGSPESTAAARAASNV